jgi:two-component system NarL family response regulator
METQERKWPAGKANPIRVLVADDFPVVREGLASIVNLQEDMQVIAEAGDGEAAVDQFRRHRPDVALLDMRMPKLDGIAAVTAIRDFDPEARVILLSAFAGDELVYRALRAGAKSYFLKGTPKQDLLEAIRKTYHDSSCISPAIAAKLVARISRSELSSRELEVLRLMAVGKSNKEIGVTLCIAEGTVKAHVSKLLKKLNVTGRTEAIKAAVLHGMVDLEA